MLRQSVERGVTCRDTANTYMGGKSAEGIGRYLAKHPGDRKRLFGVTKSHAWATSGLSEDLHQSLERMRTDYVALFFLHSMSHIYEDSCLDPDFP
jgi:aryl-alcohol dehydrogenase-like predicted oxidoreductase